MSLLSKHVLELSSRLSLNVEFGNTVNLGSFVYVAALAFEHREALSFHGNQNKSFFCKLILITP